MAHSEAAKQNMRKPHRKMSVEDRMFALSHPEPNTGCWLWSGTLTDKGYGTLNIGAKHKLAHRVSYELHKGQIPEGLQIDHLCRVRQCVNPEHLEPVTRRENLLRGVGVAAQHAAKTHCPKGHPYEGENLWMHRNQRWCRECMRQKTRARFALHRDQINAARRVKRVTQW